MASLSAEDEALYNDLLSETEGADDGLGKLFYQEDLQELPAGKGRPVEDLMKIIQNLVTFELLKTSKQAGRLCWNARTRDAARALRGLSAEEKMVYGYIEDAQEKGIWVREIKKKTNLHNTIVDKAIRKIENSRLIKGVKNVKHPAQKTYLLYHLQPSDEITGGSFFDAGSLDRSLVGELCNIIVFHVHQNSWSSGRVRSYKRDASPTIDDDAVQTKRRRDGDAVMDGGNVSRGVKPRSSRRDEQEVPIVYLAYSRQYPTCETIHKFIVDTGVLRDKGSTLTTAELQGVIDVLVWDDKLERIGGGYRTVRGVNHRPIGGYSTDMEDSTPVGNGLTQSPCWRCPVFELCGNGGPINANSCVYFQEWLEIGL